MNKINIINAIFEYFFESKISRREKFIVAFIALGYFCLPFDLIPDVIPVIGWLDDIGMGLLMMAFFAKRLQIVRAPNGTQIKSIQEDELEPQMGNRPSNSDYSKQTKD